MTKPLVTTAENIYDNTKTYCYNDCIFVTPRFRQDILPIKLAPKQITVDTTTCANILSCIDKTWDESEFKNIRQPIVASRVVNQKLFSSPIKNNAKRVLDMPIKFPNSSTYIIPQECSQFAETIQQIIDYYHSLYTQLFNSDETLVNDYYCYLTIDQGFVPKDTMQRKSGLHVDGFQGERVQPKVKINHSFIVSDCVPAVYYMQPFDTSALDPSVHDYFLAFERQKQSSEWRPNNYDIVMMDAYTVHSGDYATSDCTRTFLRLSFDVREFDRLGNAINPFYDYNWEYVPRASKISLV